MNILKRLHEEIKLFMGEADMQDEPVDIPEDPKKDVPVREYLQSIFSAFGLVDITSDKESGEYFFRLTFEDETIINLEFILGEGDNKPLLLIKTEKEVFNISLDPGVYNNGQIDLMDKDNIPLDAIIDVIRKTVNTEDSFEDTRIVIRGGKPIKKKILHNPKKKKKQSAKQKAALAKARKKAHTFGAKKNRAKSQKVRKRLGVKNAK